MAIQSNKLFLQDKMDEAAAWPPYVRPGWVRGFKKQSTLKLLTAQAESIYKEVCSTRPGGRTSLKELVAGGNVSGRHEFRDAKQKKD